MVSRGLGAAHDFSTQTINTRSTLIQQTRNSTNFPLRKWDAVAGKTAPRCEKVRDPLFCSHSALRIEMLVQFGCPNLTVVLPLGLLRASAFQILLPGQRTQDFP